MSPLQISYTNNFLPDACFQFLSSPFLLTSSSRCYHSLVTLPPVSLPNHLAKCCFIILIAMFIELLPSFGMKENFLWPWAWDCETVCTWTSRPCTVWLESAWGLTTSFYSGIPDMIGFVFSTSFLQAERQYLVRNTRLSSFGPWLPLTPHPALLLHIYTTVHPNHLLVIQSHTLVIWAQCFIIIMFPWLCMRVSSA